MSWNTTTQMSFIHYMRPVEQIFEHFTEDFTDKIIYCPFDSEESNFVKYIKDNKDKLKYRELWYTSDDWTTHLDLFESADYIISNPPFSELIHHYKISGIRKQKSGDGILQVLSRLNKKFFLLGNNLCIYNYSRMVCLDTRFYPATLNFSRPGGRIVRHPGICYLTNIDNSFDCKRLNLVKSVSQLDTYIAETQNGDTGLMIDRIKDIPYDYDDWMFVPVTILHYHKDFDKILFGSVCTKFTNVPEGRKHPFARIRIKIQPN